MTVLWAKMSHYDFLHSIIIDSFAVWREGHFGRVAGKGLDSAMFPMCDGFDWYQGALIRGIFVGRGGIFRLGRS